MTPEMRAREVSRMLEKTNTRVRGRGSISARSSVTIARNMGTLQINATFLIEETLEMMKQDWPKKMVMRDKFC